MKEGTISLASYSPSRRATIHSAEPDEVRDPRAEMSARRASISLMDSAILARCSASAYFVPFAALIAIPWMIRPCNSGPWTCSATWTDLVASPRRTAVSGTDRVALARHGR
jgi:hypothetical protein